MTQLLSRPIESRTSCRSRTWTAAAALLFGIAAGCATTASRPSSTVSDADLGRLAPGQARAVDDARSHLTLAQDELGRAKLGVVDNQHEGELAHADQANASADAGRAAAETKIGKDSNEPGQMQRARDDTRSAQDAKSVADARQSYAKELATAKAAQVTAATRKVDLMTEKVNLAKLQSLDEAGIPVAGKYDHASAMQRVVDAQRRYDEAKATASVSAADADSARQHWQDLDRKRM